MVTYETAILDAIHATLARIDGSGDYYHAPTAVAAHNGAPLLAGTPPIVLVSDPSVSVSAASGDLLGDDHTLSVGVMLLAPSPGPTQADRIRGAQLAWSDLRRALLHRDTGAWLGVTAPGSLLRLQLSEVVYQPEDDPRSSRWYSMARCTVLATYRVRYPSVGAGG